MNKSAMQSLARGWAASKGLKLETLDSAQRDGMIRELSERHQLAPDQLREALVQDSGAATEAAGKAIAAFEDRPRAKLPGAAADPLADAIQSGDAVQLAKASSRAVGVGASVDAIVGLKKA